MSKKRANGEGNIRKRKNGRWEGRYTAGYDPKTGKRINKNVLGKTQAEVREKPKTAMAECQGLDVSREADEHTVATWLKMWYELYAKPNVRTATANRYQLIIDTYTVPRIGNIKLKKMTTRHLQKLYKELLESGRIQIGKSQHGPQRPPDAPRRSGPGSKRTAHSPKPLRELHRPKAPKTGHESLISRADGGLFWKPHSGEICSLCFIWNWSADCGRENWWPCGGTTWMSKAKLSR